MMMKDTKKSIFGIIFMIDRHFVSKKKSSALDTHRRATMVMTRLLGNIKKLLIMQTLFIFSSRHADEYSILYIFCNNNNISLLISNPSAILHIFDVSKANVIFT